MPAAPRARRRRRLFALVACGLGCAIGLAGVELVLRRVDLIGRNYEPEFRAYLGQALRYAWEDAPDAPFDLDGHLFRHRPGLDLDLGSFRLRTNHLGFRGPEVAEPKPAGTFRLLLLGDSVAFGWGVDDEATFARRLEVEWNQAAPARRLEVVNTGHPMYDTCQQAATLREFLPRLEPDLVLLVYVVNDVEPTRDLAEGLLHGRQPPASEALEVPDDVWSWLERRLRPVLPATAQFLGARTDLDARVAAMLPPGEVYRPERSGKGPRGWPRSQAALLEIRDRCAAAGVPLLVFDHTRPPIEALPPFCREQGIACAELRFTADEFRQGITNSRLDPHANAKGHALLLQKLRAVLTARRLLPD
ncbi:MAG: SGNH/GDSL hydrolase family protein [Planctomycetes bacterium]|nr:SGNH/GDSL hydrolase family protein [Planctomycetota bacterium]